MLSPVAVVTETMEQVSAHITKYLALHPEITDDRETVVRAVGERWRGADPADIMLEAMVNSIAAKRLKGISDVRQNPLVSTEIQGDLFHDVPVRVPQMLIVNGKPTPYYEASVLDGLAFWEAQASAKASAAEAFELAGATRRREEVEARSEASKHRDIIRTAQMSGIDASTLRYAKA